MRRPRTRPALSLAAAALSLLLLAGCSAADTGHEASHGAEHQEHASASASAGHDDASHASAQPSTGEHGSGAHGHHHDGGEVPAGMTPATDAKYPDGAHVRLSADHMEGMDGAEATVVGSYDTFVYAVDYEPTTGGPEVRDHRWVVQEEIRDAGTQRLPDGAEVTLTADHMEGMDGAHARIVSSTDEPVYVVDYTTPDGQTMTNHRWVVQSEIEER